MRAGDLIRNTFNGQTGIVVREAEANGPHDPETYQRPQADRAVPYAVQAVGKTARANGEGLDEGECSGCRH